MKQVRARLIRDLKNAAERKVYVGDMKKDNLYGYEDVDNKVYAILFISTSTRYSWHQSGSYRGELLLTLFATHKAIDDKTNFDYGRPVGALALCCVAVMCFIASGC